LIDEGVEALQRLGPDGFGKRDAVGELPAEGFVGEVDVARAAGDFAEGALRAAGPDVAVRGGRSGCGWPTSACVLSWRR